MAMIYNLAFTALRCLGDSITQEQFRALECKPLPLVDSRSGDLRPDITWTLQGGGMIQYLRFNQLIANTTAKLVNGWPYEVVQQADLVALKAGHYKNQHVALARTRVSALSFKNHDVFAFRSLFMPRGDCAFHQGPLRDESPVFEWSHHTAHNWLKLPMMNDVWLDAFDSAGPTLRVPQQKFRNEFGC